MQKTLFTRIFALSIAIACVFGALSAQPVWEKVNGPNEGVSTMTATSTNDVYLGTTNYGVFHSADAGVSWTAINQGLNDPLIRALGTSSNDEVFVGTGSNGIFKYNNGVWTPINTGLPSGTLIPWSFAKGLNGDMYMVTTSDDVYKWDGASWSSIKYNLPALARVIAVGSTGIVYVGCFNSGVYKFDGSSTWTSIGVMPNSFVTRMVISPTDTLYVACNSNNIYRIPAAGGSWVSINTGLPALNATAMGIDAQSNLFLAFTVNSYGQIYRSTNRGGSWSIVSGSLSTTSFNSFCATNSGQVYAGASGVYKSSNQGNSWQDMNPGLDARKTIVSFTAAADGKMYVGTQYDGIWRSADNGNTWQWKITGLTTLRSFQITTNAAGNLLYSAFIVGTPSYTGLIFRSTNNGDSWTQVAANGTDIYTKIKQHVADTIWATGRFGGPVLSFSVNNGATWMNRPIPGFSAVWDIEFGLGSTIFLGSESEGVTRSTDGGNTWTPGVGNTIPWYGNLIEVEMDHNGYLFAATDWWTNMLWFSAPGSNGDAWTEFQDSDLSGLNDINDLVFDNHNNAYIATNNGPYNDPVYMANNSAWNANTSWVSASAGLPAESVAAAFSFDAAGYLYVVTYINANGEGGLYRTTLPVNGAPLAVEFADPISASNVNDAIEIVWATATEKICSHFDVERRGDGLDFEKIGTVKGNGSTSDYHRYSMVDNHPITGINYYRIKEMDLDGGYTYSKIVAAQYKNFALKAFPSPTRGIFNFQSDQTIEAVEITNYLGTVLKTIANPSTRIDISDLPNGLYFIKFWTGNTPTTIKMMKI